MKNHIITLAILLLSLPILAQPDTTAFSAQRVKVNTLLSDRSAKFGQYDESLNQRTGIFGWQTKKDIKNSNEILRQVVLTDNNIFKELKILMDYKDLQNQQKVAVADQSEEKSNNYKLSIKKLQDQNEELRTELKQKNSNTSTYIIVGLIILVIGLIFKIYKMRTPA